jgi:positive regulator of sigma E activity
MDPLIPELTLIELRVLRDRNRRRAGALRFSLYALGLLHLVMTGWVLVAGRDNVAIFYAPAFLLIAVATGRRYRRDAQQSGIQVSLLPWLASGLTYLVLAMIASRLGFVLDWPILTEIGPTLLLALTYHLLGWWGRNRNLIIATAAMFAVSALAAVLARGDTSVAIQTCADGILLILAATSTSQEGTG